MDREKLEELKEYINSIQKLEMALYTEKELQKKHMDVLKSNYPEPPKKRKIENPSFPKIEDYMPTAPKESVGLSIIMFLFFLGFIFQTMLYSSSLMEMLKHIAENGVSSLSISNAFSSNFEGSVMEFIFYLGFTILEGFLSISYFRNEIKSSKLLEKQKQEGSKKFDQAQARYNIIIENNKKVQNDIENEYEEEMLNYKRKTLAQYKKSCTLSNNKHEKMILEIKTALDDLYNYDVIFPKYRNLVAISSIKEYLESGRCYELEGPDGAYNMYEMELRQNLIIDKLTDIVENLNEIKENQYLLYQSLNEANEKIDYIMNDIENLNSTASLNAYYSQISALAATAPRVTYGYTKIIN